MQSEVRQILDLDLRLHLIGSHLANLRLHLIYMSQEFLFRHWLRWIWRTLLLDLLRVAARPEPNHALKEPRCSTCCGSLPRVDMENMLLKRQAYLSSTSSVSLCSKSCSDPYRITLAYVRIRQHNLSICPHTSAASRAATRTASPSHYGSTRLLHILVAPDCSIV